MLNNVVIGRTAEARYKACPAGVVIRVAPIGVKTHGSLSNAEGHSVQRRICIRPIEFCVPAGRRLLACNSLAKAVTDSRQQNLLPMGEFTRRSDHCNSRLMLTIRIRQ